MAHFRFFFVLIVLSLGTFPSAAGVFITEKSCWKLVGEVVKATPDFLDLKIFRYTRSEEILHIEFVPPLIFQPPEPQDLIRLSVPVSTPGNLAKAKLKSKESSLHFLSHRQFKTLEGVTVAQKGSCR